jgi:hypothetical protein
MRLLKEKREDLEMKKSYYEFVVRGTSSFPLDMLRYDCCYPASQDGVSNMIGRGGSTREVTLKADSPPTPGRWASFGWQVVKEEKKVRT